MGEILGDMSGGVRKYGSEWKENFDMMCRLFIKEYDCEPAVGEGVKE